KILITRSSRKETDTPTSSSVRGGAGQMSSVSGSQPHASPESSRSPHAVLVEAPPSEGGMTKSGIGWPPASVTSGSHLAHTPLVLASTLQRASRVLSARCRWLVRTVDAHPLTGLRAGTYNSAEAEAARAAAGEG